MSGTPARRRAGLFIAGTDTGVGKTQAAVAIVRALVRRGLQVAVMKPVAAGAIDTAHGPRNEDAVALTDAANVAADYALVNPYCLRAPISPHLAAAEQGVSIDRLQVAHAFACLAQRAECVIVEGAGGWLAPISEQQTMADIARALELPVLLVVGLKLGCLSHAQLTARAIEADGLRFAGWIANAVDPRFERLPENLATLERLLARPPLAFVPHGAKLSAAELSAAAAERLIELLPPCDG
jgi:dethiobiotin synthetase